MARKFGFRPSFRQTLTTNAAYLANMAGGTLPADLQRSLDAAMPPTRKKREIKDGVDIDAVHRTKRAVPIEAEVVHAISQLLAAHPLVLFACRQNSGAASYEAKSGKYAPVHFYRVLRAPSTLTITDFWGVLRDGRMWALEAKRESWRSPTTDRENRQAAFLEMVRDAGGKAGFVRSAEEAKQVIEN